MVEVPSHRVVLKLNPYLVRYTVHVHERIKVKLIYVFIRNLASVFVADILARHDLDTHSACVATAIDIVSFSLLNLLC